jgi:carbon monoxide dehydrogenase subunit G
MASIYKEIRIDAPADQVWDAVRDFGALPERLVPGFVVAAELLEDVRTITFFNGSVARERLVGIDDDARRLAYSVLDGALGTTHHNASVQVFAADNGQSRFVWITDVLPHELESTVGALMDQALVVIEQTLEANQPASQLT